jgi:hypothetical protein
MNQRLFGMKSPRRVPQEQMVLERNSRDTRRRRHNLG